MSVFSGPSIPSSNNLVLHLDALNSKSYNGTTTWFDLSSSKTNGTMFGTVPVSSDGGGCFDFSTVTGTGLAPANTATLGFSFAANMIPTLGSFTLSTWIKNPPVSVGQVTLFSNAGSTDGYRWGIGLDAVYIHTGGAGGVGFLENSLNFSSALSSSLWYNIVTVFDRSGTNTGGIPQWQSYLNGISHGTLNMGTPQTTAFSNTTPGIIRNPCCNLFTGKLAIFSAYNTALTASQILTNFNALRGRFGV